MIDLNSDLAVDSEVVPEKEVVGLVDAACLGILDRDNTELCLPACYSVEDIAEGATGQEIDLTEETQYGFFTERPLFPLKRYRGHSFPSSAPRLAS